MAHCPLLGAHTFTHQRKKNKISPWRSAVIRYYLGKALANSETLSETLERATLTFLVGLTT